MSNLRHHFPHILELIFGFLDDQSLMRSRQVCKSWQEFIDCQKFTWIRIIKGMKVYFIYQNLDFHSFPLAHYVIECLLLNLTHYSSLLDLEETFFVK